MSKFGDLLEEEDLFDSTEDDTPQVAFSASRFVSDGKQAMSYASGPLTEVAHNCYVFSCPQPGCEEPLLYSLDTNYYLEVGFDRGVPKEISFAVVPYVIRKGSVAPWSEHELASEEVIALNCPCCGKDAEIVLTKDGDLCTGELEEDDRTEVPVPRNRIAFRDTPLPEWTTQDL